MKRGALVSALAIVLVALVLVGRLALNEEPEAAPEALRPGGATSLEEAPKRQAVELAPVPERPQELDEPAAPKPGETSAAKEEPRASSGLAGRGAEPRPGPAGQDAPPPEAPFSGRVFAQDGSGARAKVTLVRQGGSWSRTTDEEGRFAFADDSGGGASFSAGTYALVVATDGGDAAVHEGIQWSPGAPSVKVDLTVEPGVKVAFQLTGTRESARVRVLSGGLPIADFTLRNGTPATEILPATSLLAQLYEGDTVFGERAISGFPGAEESVEFELDE